MLSSLILVCCFAVATIDMPFECANDTHAELFIATDEPETVADSECIESEESCEVTLAISRIHGKSPVRPSSMIRGNVTDCTQ